MRLERYALVAVIALSSFGMVSFHSPDQAQLAQIGGTEPPQRVLTSESAVKARGEGEAVQADAETQLTKPEIKRFNKLDVTE